MTEGPGYRPELITRNHSLPRRIAQLAAGLGGLASALLIGLLWATEPGGVPGRTAIAFGALIAIGLSWAAYAVSVVFRRPLFAMDRLLGAWMAVWSTTLMVAGMVVIGVVRASALALAVAGLVGLPLLAGSLILLARARSYHAALLTRHRDLQARNQEQAHNQEQGDIMTPRRPAPIGPLAIAMRHRSRIGWIALVVGLALLAGVGLLFLR